MKSKVLLILLIVCSFALIGCGKGLIGPLSNLSAKAGDDQSVFVALQSELDGSMSSGSPESYSWSVKSLPSGVSALSIISSNESKAFFIPPSAGVYEFELQVQKNSNISRDTVRYTVTAFSKALIDPGFYGICCHLSSHDGSPESKLNTSVQAISDIGAQFVRFDFSWKDIEPSDGQFNFGKYDNIVSKLQAQNIKILGILDYTNTWCDPTTGDASSINKFSDFAYNLAKHYKSDIKLWEIWNEPNNASFWDIPDAVKYLKLLKSSYGAIKQANPNATVVLGGLLGNGRDAVTMGLFSVTPPNYLDDLYAAGAKNYFDVVAIHPYDSAKWIDSTTSLEVSIDKARSLMDSYGDSAKEIWLTELGPLYFPPDPVTFVSTIGYTQSQEAGWVHLMYTNLRSKCDKIFYYELMDSPNGGSIYDPNWEGLMGSGAATKESYSVYKNFAK